MLTTYHPNKEIQRGTKFYSFFYDSQPRGEGGEKGRSERVLLIVEEFISECIRLNKTRGVKFKIRIKKHRG